MLSSRMNVFASAIGMCFIAAFSAATTHAQTGRESFVTDSIGGQQFRFSVRAGECALDAKQVSDKRLLDNTAQIISATNSLHVISANCQELADWRTGKVKFLGGGMQIQSFKAAANQNLRGQEKVLVSQICTQFRTSSGDLQNQAESTLKKKFEETSSSRLESLQLMGVMGEDEHACYVAARVAGKNELGGDTVRAMVFASMILEGKLIYIYRSTERVGLVAYEQMMTEATADVRRQVAANKR
jgi:hypothetical protein